MPAVATTVAAQPFTGYQRSRPANRQHHQSYRQIAMGFTDDFSIILPADMHALLRQRPTVSEAGLLTGMSPVAP